MKTTLLFMLFSLNSLAAVSDLEKQLEKKSGNYLELREYYVSLLVQINNQNDKVFCEQVKRSIPLLNLMFADDQQLITALRSFQDTDYREFATHIEENSFSPLFSSLSFSEMCDNNRREDILGLTQSLQYHVMNVDYLSMSNQLFWQSINVKGPKQQLSYWP